MTEEKPKVNPGYKYTGDNVVFPNHACLTGLNYTVDLGSFDVPMRKLLDYALFVVVELKKIEREE